MKTNLSKNHSNKTSYNWLLYNKMDDFLLKMKDKIKGDVYDLGCGESPYKKFFLSCAQNYIGVDWSESLYNSKPEIVANLNQELPIDNGVADCVISISVMEHLSEPQTMLNEANRILKKGGFLIMQVPWQWKIHEAPHDFFRYSPYGLKLMLNKAGFKQIIIDPSSGFFTTWLIKLNYFLKRFIRGPKIIRLIIKLILMPIWFINQIVAPLLDNLDKNWELETQGYNITAKK